MTTTFISCEIFVIYFSEVDIAYTVSQLVKAFLPLYFSLPLFPHMNANLYTTTYAVIRSSSPHTLYNSKEQLQHEVSDQKFLLLWIFSVLISFTLLRYEASWVSKHSQALDWPSIYNFRNSCSPIKYLMYCGGFACSHRFFLTRRFWVHISVDFAHRQFVVLLKHLNKMHLFLLTQFIRCLKTFAVKRHFIVLPCSVLNNIGV